MFTKHIPRTGKPVGQSNSTITHRAAAAFGVVALTAGFALVAPTAAVADDVAESYAEGQFLSGSIAGLDLAQVVELAAAQAHNNGTQSLQTSKDPLNATVLQAVNVSQPGGVQIPLNSFIDAGAVNQYAEADKGGVSMGSSGAIGDDGGIGAGAVGSGSAGDLDIDVDPLLQEQYASILTDLTVSLEAVAAQASANLTTASGDYTIADATLILHSPAIGQLTDKVNAALGTVDQRLLALEGDDGVLGNVVDGVLDPVLGVLGSSADVTVNIDTDLHAAVASLLGGDYGNGAVHFNLQTGAIEVDLEALLGGELNDLPPNTELLTDAAISQVLKGITDTVATLADQIVDRVELALHNAKVDIHADLDLLTPQAPEQTQVCNEIQVPIIGDILGGAGGLLGGLLGGGSGSGPVQGIIGYTTQTVCNLVETVLPDLHSSVNVDIEGTVDQLLSGAAAKADASISLLGGTVNAAVNVDAILDGLANGLTDSLFDGDGTVQSLVDSLNGLLVNPAVTGLLGNSGIEGLLTDVLSIKVNVQETSTTSEGSMFTETAVRVAVLGGDLATVNVAAATVGPNVNTIVDPGCQTNCNPPCTVNCGPGGDPDPCFTNCPAGNPNPGTSGFDRLAMTGVGIATLIAVILALLAAGAILAREGYRRNHPQVLNS